MSQVILLGCRQNPIRNRKLRQFLENCKRLTLLHLLRREFRNVMFLDLGHEFFDFPLIVQKFDGLTKVGQFGTVHLAIRHRHARDGVGQPFFCPITQGFNSGNGHFSVSS